MRTRRAGFGRALAALFALALTTEASAGVLKKPYLLYEGQSTAMTVLWQDDRFEATNTLSWGTDPSCGLGNATVPEYGRSHQHKHTLAGLKPGTRYYYRVADGAKVYGSGSFVAAPDAKAKAAKFLAFGDTRSAPLVLEGVVREMRKACAADAAFCGLVLHSGDWVSKDDEPSWAAEWFNGNPEMSRLLAGQPVVGVKGNHEDTGGYSRYFPLYYPFPYVRAGEKPGDPLSRSGLYWSFDYGPVHFTIVDQYAPCGPGSAQHEWVVEDLAATTRPWKVLVLHEPPWGAGKHRNHVPTQQVFDPLIREYGIDLVYSGHNHSYVRAQFQEGDRTVVPGRADSIVPGVPYFTGGGGGAPLYATDVTDAGPFRHVRKALSEHGYMTFEVDGETLVAKAYAVYRDDGDPRSRVRLSGRTPNPATKSVLIETVVLAHPRPPRRDE